MSDKTVTPRDYSIPEIYMPLLQFIVRMSLAALAGIYYYWLPIPALLFTRPQIFLMIGIFAAFHMIWWWHYKKKGVGKFGVRLGTWVDLIGASIATMADPFSIPPMVLMVFIAILGDGIQHGLKVFLEVLLGGLLLSIAVFGIRHPLIDDWAPYNLLFFVFMLVFCLYYSYMLIRRIEQMRKEAEEIGEHDLLTGLLNRRAFVKSAKYLLSLHERTRIPLVFMFADLDDFKQVNDTFGHEMGDRVLQYYAELVKKRLRRTDVSARYGGDEFVFILTDISVEGAQSVALRLQREFTNWARNKDMNVGVSFGLGAVPEGATEIEEILRNVDAALYDAKQMKGQPGSISVLNIAEANQ